MQTTKHIFRKAGTTPTLTRDNTDVVLSNPEHIFAVLNGTQGHIGEKPRSIAALKFRSACNW